MSVSLKIFLLFCSNFLPIQSNPLIDIVLKSKNDICKTWIVSSDEDSDITEGLSSEKLTSTTSLPIVNINQNNFSDRIAESLNFIEQEDPFTSKFILKFARTCSIVIVKSFETQTRNEITKTLILKKLARPHKDYFVFLGKRFTIDESTNPYLENIRYKYSLESSKDETQQFSQFCKEEIFSRKCSNILNGKKLRTTIVFGPQMFRFEHNEEGSLSSAAGTYYEMLKESSHHLNFTFSIKRASQNGASGLKKNGVWTGAMGDVLYGKADISVNAALSFSRYQIVDPSVAVAWIARTFYIRKPPLSTSWTAIFRPLTLIVWNLTGVVLLLISLLYFFSTLIQFREVGYNQMSLDTIIETNFAIFAMFIEQPIPVTKKSWPGSRIRFVIFIMCSFAVVMRTAYSSKLVEFLAVLDSEPIPMTHQELADSDYTLYFRYYGGFAYQHMKMTNTSTHTKILQKAILVNTSYDCITSAGMAENSACLDYNFNGDYAILTNGTLNSHAADAGVFTKSDDQEIPMLMTYCYRKGSPITETLDEYLLHYISSGLYRFWISRDWEKSKLAGAAWLQSQKESRLRKQFEIILNDLAAGPKPLSLSSTFGVFLILLIGLGAAFLIFITEFIYGRIIQEFMKLRFIYYFWKSIIRNGKK